MTAAKGAWRYYPRPDDAVHVGTAALGFVRGIQRNTNERARKRQRELLRATGFAGGHAELANIVAYELARRKVPPSVASYAAHLCSVGGRYNFQGNPRVSRLMRRSLRSAQRYRAQLEAAGLLRSNTLEAGDMVEGQRAPVSRPQVVRDLSALRAFALGAPRRDDPPAAPAPAKRPRPSSGLSAAAVPVPSPALTPDELRTRAAAWLAANPLASAAPRTPRRPLTDPPVRVPPDGLDPQELADWERDTESLERYLEWLKRPPDKPS